VLQFKLRVMGKEGIEKKPTQKRDINNEYPKWPWVDYKFQDVNFFLDVRKLLAERDQS